MWSGEVADGSACLDSGQYCVTFVLLEVQETEEEGALSAVRLITLFRPQDWYSQTKGKVEEVVRRKWAQARALARRSCCKWHAAGDCR